MFFTSVQISDYPFKISYRDNSFWIGSCFTTNIGEAMKSLKFRCEVNPFGALYNPVSILEGLKLLLHKKQLTANNLFETNELWNSFAFHSSYSNTDKLKALEGMNSKLKIASEMLYSSNYLFITLGTAYVYKFKKNGEIVGNCHKLPAKEFDHYILSITDIVKQYNSLIASLTEHVPGIKIIFSVSPIRHLKNGAHSNQLSKSVLLLAIDDIISKNKETCFYFPSYEIALDELRDYRFYEKDMCHLSETAIEHIRNTFINSVIDTKSQQIMEDVKKLNLARAHRPFNTNTTIYKKFVESTDRKEAELKKQYPYLAW